MKYLYLILFSVVLVGCNTDHEISGEVSVGVDYSVPQIRQVNGILYVRGSIADITQSCIAIDSSALYGAEWGNLEIQDLNRTAVPTQEQIDNCL